VENLLPEMSLWLKGDFLMGKIEQSFTKACPEHSEGANQYMFGLMCIKKYLTKA
jgi:hypothetical protein